MKRSLVTLLVLVSALSHAGARFIVEVQDYRQILGVARSHPVSLIDIVKPAPFALVEVKPGFDPIAVQLQMRADPRVRFCEDNVALAMPEHIGAGKGSTIGAVFDDGIYGENSNLLAQIQWSLRPWRGTDRKVRVGILDTGISRQNPWLLSRVAVLFPIARDRADAWDMPTGVDSNRNFRLDEALGHGSMVAGLVAQIAPYAELVICRVADADGQADAWTITKGIARSVLAGCEVVNISLGSEQAIPALSDVMHYAEDRGTTVVAAIGNNGYRGANYPADISKVVMVTGVNQNDIKAPFSNWDGGARQAAPATGIKSAWWDGTIGIWSGTSFASPLVAGAIADALRSVPRVPPVILRDEVEQSGTNIDPLNPDYDGELGNRLDCADLARHLGVP